ncbi:hypothetical protein BJX76DRAFT_315863, partial [Aspergillus varians]
MFYYNFLLACFTGVWLGCHTIYLLFHLSLVLMMYICTLMLTLLTDTRYYVFNLRSWIA